MRFTRITIIQSRRPAQKNINEELQWIGGSLGLFNLRDKDKSCFRVFIELLKSPEGLSSDEMAARLGLARGTVLHHVGKLMEAGIVSQQKSRYALTVDSLEELVDAVQGNVTKALDEMRKIAKDVDERLGRHS